MRRVRGLQDQACARAIERWSFDSKQRWHYDSDNRTLWFFDEGTATAVVADVEIVGTYSTRSNTWMWAWGNDQYPLDERAKIAPMQLFGEVRAIQRLSQATWDAEEVDAWEVTRIAACLLGAEAIYRAPMSHLHVFMLLRQMRSETLRPGLSDDRREFR